MAGRDGIQGELVAALSSRGFPSKVLRVGTDEGTERVSSTGEVGRCVPARSVAVVARACLLAGAVDDLVHRCGRAALGLPGEHLEMGVFVHC